MRAPARVVSALVLAFGASICALPALGAIPVVDDCVESDYQDRTQDGANRTLIWDFSFPGRAERCLKIRVGQSVRWNGNFAEHPLDPDQGDVPSPIASPDESGVVTFSSLGVFGFRCNYHFEMRGAIQVVAASAPAAVPGSHLGGRLALAVALLSAGAFVAWRTSRKRRRNT